ncbi:uncharacterized protein LOC111114126 [Crassostrea virginica]
MFSGISREQYRTWVKENTDFDWTCRNCFPAAEATFHISLASVDDNNNSLPAAGPAPIPDMEEIMEEDMDLELIPQHPAPADPAPAAGAPADPAPAAAAPADPAPAAAAPADPAPLMYDDNLILIIFNVFRS